MKLEGLSAISDPNLRRILQQVQSFFSSMESDYGLVPVTSPQTRDKQSRVDPPPLPSFASVVGGNGRLTITLNDLAPTSPTSGLILYEIQTSLTQEFSSSTTVTKYGPDPRLAWEIQNPGATLYLQVRARFTNSKFTKPVPWGPAVDAGLINSSALSSSLTPVASDTSAPILVQDGANPNIIVNSSTLTIPSSDPNAPSIIQYAAGEILNLDFDTYYVYADDPKKRGGSVVYVATKNYANVIAYEGRISFGSITLSSRGGGTGPGSTAGVILGTPMLKLDGTTQNIELLKQGDRLYGVSGSIETLVRDPELVGSVPVIHMETQLGAYVNAGTGTPYVQGDGGLRPISNAVPGGSITVADPSQLPAVVAAVSDTITAVQFLGNMPIYKLYLDNQRYCYANNMLIYFGATAPNPADPSAFIPLPS